MIAAEPPAIDRRAEVVRRFNRLYTKRIGVLQERMYAPFTLAEGRMLYEIAHRDGITATDVAANLDLDPGYVSRLLRSLEDRGLLERRPAPDDGRRAVLALTAAGRAAFESLDRRSHDEIVTLLGALSEPAQRALVEAMRTIETHLDDARSEAPVFVLRPHEPGDMGTVVARNAALYTQEYGWNDEYEALVAEIVATFLRTFDARRERCWIAEQNGTFAGCVFVVKASEEAAQLRLLLVEPSARGYGLGRRLVDECVRFARRAGYTTLRLWTNDILHAARRIYQDAGFVLVREEPHRSFGHDLVGQIWELTLR